MINRLSTDFGHTQIILGVASAPEAPATSTSPAKKGKKAKKTVKKVT
jgi:hypothetical protein